MPVKNSVKLIKFAFKKYPLEPNLQRYLVRSFHSSNIVNNINSTLDPLKSKTDLVNIRRNITKSVSYHQSSSDPSKPKSYDR